MSEENDASSKTEEPTPRRLEEARRKGEIAKSIDLAQWSSLAGVAGVLAILGGWMCQDMARRLLPFIERPDDIRLEGDAAVEVLRVAALACFPALAVILGAACASGIFGNLIQTGLMWAPERLKPEIKKVNPLEGFKRLFGVDGLVQFLKSALKIAVVACVAWWAMRPYAADLEGLSALEPAAILPFTASILRALIFAVIVVLGVGALADWLWQRHRFMQKMRMSREELKEDVRQSEGDPHMKARVRQIRVERARRRMIQQVPKATVVVMNPTHYAVALRYEAGETAAPVCLAKGLDRIALKIREVAEQNDVPVVEDPPLARALYATVEVDQAIPLQHYEAVAKVIGFVLNNARRGRGAAR